MNQLTTKVRVETQTDYTVDSDASGQKKRAKINHPQAAEHPRLLMILVFWSCDICLCACLRYLRSSADNRCIHPESIVMVWLTQSEEWHRDESSHVNLRCHRFPVTSVCCLFINKFFQLSNLRDSWADLKLWSLQTKNMTRFSIHPNLVLASRLKVWNELCYYTIITDYV